MTTSIVSVDSTTSKLQVGGVDAFTFDATGITVGADLGIRTLTATVASSALTISLLPCTLQFRSATLSSGVVTQMRVTSTISLVVPSTATLGTVSAQQSRLVVLAINNAGTVELAVVNILGGNDLSETGLITTTSLSATADAANVIYSNAARISVAYRVVGYIESTQATAGTWASTPSTIQGQGGNALAAMSSIGYGQTWQDVSGSRAIGTTYYNTTGRPIFVLVTAYSAVNSSSGLRMFVNGLLLSEVATTDNNGALYQALRNGIGVIVPAGVSYQAAAAGVALTVGQWAELR